MKRILLVLLVFAAIAVAVRYSHASGSGSMPAVGSQAPDFTLTSQEGTDVTLSQFRGKWVVLYFYPKDMTSGCTVEAHNFQRDQSQFTALNAAIVGVSVDNADSHKQFCTKEGLTFKLLADKDKKVVKMYDTEIPVIGISARDTFLVSPEGKIVKVWTKVDPQVHSGEVIAELKKEQGKS